MREVSDENKHLLSMTTAAIGSYLRTACDKGMTCNLDTAERCVIEAQSVKSTPLYKDGKLYTTCRYERNVIRGRAMLRENLSSGFLTMSDTNRAVKPQKMARGLTRFIKEI